VWRETSTPPVLGKETITAARLSVSALLSFPAQSKTT
jgi:hypothetical protein